MNLSQEQHKKLLIQAQNIRPVVIIGNNGLSDAVQAEITVALHAHELIKVKVNANSREERKRMIESICEVQEAALIQAVGHVVVIYKQREEK